MKTLIRAPRPKKDRMKAILFDMDGTLIDTRDYIVKTINETYVEIGIAPRTEKEWMQEIRDGVGMRAYMRNKGIENRYDEFRETYTKNYSAGLSETKIIRGTDKLLEKLASEGIKTGIYTLAYRPMMQAALERFGLKIDCAVAKDDVEKPKPHPEQVLLLCKRLGVRPEETIAIGDLECDIQSGKSAGTKTAGVLTGFGTRKEFMRTKPDWVLESAIQVMGLKEARARALRTEGSG
jgi:HAD superfamily hydrolase (TIGR01509 family)